MCMHMCMHMCMVTLWYRMLARRQRKPAMRIARLSFSSSSRLIT